jgi:hypothetical protein
MTGIHTYLSRNHEGNLYNEHVLLIQAISAMLWKQHNGDIKLYTTSRDLDFFKKIGMDMFYDEIDTDTLDKEKQIDWKDFYPAAKIKVLSTIKEFPVAFIDTDFMVKEKLELPDEYDIAYVHREGKYWKNYPPLKFLGKRKGYMFPSFIDETDAKPISTCFFVMNNSELAEEYTLLGLDYMRRNSEKCREVEWADEELRNFWKSLFVEQKLLGTLVDKGNYREHRFFDYDYYGDTITWSIDGKTHLSQSEIKNVKFPFFHLWGEKSLYYLPEFQKLRISSFYKIAQNFRSVKHPDVQEFFYRVLEYTASRMLKENSTDIYNLPEYIKLLK